MTERIKLRDKKFNKLKTAVERVVVAHDGSCSDENVSGGKVKSTYERVVTEKTLRFKYTWHNSISEYRAIKNARSQLGTHLQRLKIVEKLPAMKLREGESHADALLRFRKRTKQGRAFLALEKALDELDSYEE